MGKTQQSRNNINDNEDTSKAPPKRKRTDMDESTAAAAAAAPPEQRAPLSDVVADCTKRWFQDTLKEAKNGDVNMQIILGQMYYTGYGVPVDAKKGKIWITRASRMRSSSVWKICRKRPGYNLSDSDSDSDEEEDDDS